MICFAVTILCFFFSPLWCQTEEELRDIPHTPRAQHDTPTIVTGTLPVNVSYEYLTIDRECRLDMSKVWLKLVGSGFVLTAVGDGITLWNSDKTIAPILYPIGASLTFAGSAGLSLNHFFLCPDDSIEQKAFAEFLREKAHSSLSFCTGSSVLFSLGMAKNFDSEPNPYVLNGLAIPGLACIFQGRLGFIDVWSPVPAFYKCLLATCSSKSERVQAMKEYIKKKAPPTPDIIRTSYMVGCLGVTLCMIGRIVNLCTLHDHPTQVIGTYLNFFGMLCLLDSVIAGSWGWGPLTTPFNALRQKAC